MTDTPENHTIRLLQEIRAEMRQGFADVNARVDDLSTRMDGMTHILVMLAADLHRQDERIEKLEGRPGEGSA